MLSMFHIPVLSIGFPLVENPTVYVQLP